MSQLERDIEARFLACGFRADPSQRAAIQLLEQWLKDWLRERRIWLAEPKSGVYLWGSVGRGKSFVMDVFFDTAPVEAKRRVHFHGFLHDTLERLKDISGQRDPLVVIANEIAADTRLLCFDEFYVHDIGDAIVLGGLLARLIELGVGVVATSNYPPHKLCQKPLYRERFKPIIQMIEHRFDIFNFDGDKDYRLTCQESYVWGEVVQIKPDSQRDWIERRLQLQNPTERNVFVNVNHRTIFFQARHQATAWLNFDELCRAPRSSADFLWLVRGFKRLAIDAVPKIGNESIEVQQRFINLIDIFYDSGVELILITESNTQLLLVGSTHTDCARTCSRLNQLKHSNFRA